MKKNLSLTLSTLKNFQLDYPNSHIGGSIGLFLRGIDLKRDLNLSDLDITTDRFEFDSTIYDERSDANDFDYAIKKEHQSNGYTKIDIRLDSNCKFDVITFEGISYNVSKLEDILKWKKIYADKGVKKHINDLITIETGVRPKETSEILF